MSDRPCVIMEERKNPPIGEQRAAAIWRRKDTHRDSPVTIEESACGGADSCHYIEKERYL
jgi:hypothetical protein